MKVIFHAKGYIFHNTDAYSLIIGSSNLTANALCQNQEWNLKVSTSNQGSLILDTLKEFNRLFESATIVDSAWISEYEKIYREQSFLTDQARAKIENSHICRISPNQMQISALQALETHCPVLKGEIKPYSSQQQEPVKHTFQHLT